MRSPFLIVTFAVMLGCILDALVKHVTLETALLTMTAWRFIFGSLIAGAVFKLSKQPLPSRRAWRFHMMRAAIQTVAVLSFFWALTQLGLAEATVLGFTGALMMPWVAKVILGEKVAPLAIFAGLLGFAGAAMAVSAAPDGAPSDGNRVLGSLAVLVAALTYAVAVVLLRLRTRSDTTEALALFNNTLPAGIFAAALGVSAIIGQPLAPLLLPGGALPYVIALGFVGFSVWWLMSLAYRDAEAQHLAPFEYLALPMSAGLGFFFFDEVPGWQLYIGALIIIGACLAVVFQGYFRKTKRPVSDILT